MVALTLRVLRERRSHRTCMCRTVRSPHAHPATSAVHCPENFYVFAFYPRKISRVITGDGLGKNHVLSADTRAWSGS